MIAITNTTPAIAAANILGIDVSSVAWSLNDLPDGMRLDVCECGEIVRCGLHDEPTCGRGYCKEFADYGWTFERDCYGDLVRVWVDYWQETEDYENALSAWEDQAPAEYAEFADDYRFDGIGPGWSGRLSA